MARRRGKNSRQQNKVMNGGVYGTIWYFLIPAIIVVGFIFVMIIRNTNNTNNAYSQIANIRQYVRNGELKDYSNQIGMKDPETDIRWYKHDKYVEIVFGYMDMKFDLEEFLTPECKHELNTIGLDYKLVVTDAENKQYTLKLYYNGKELERWVTQ